MTERKAFKARVRSQMAASGQTYARAAAQLEAGNPARPTEAHPASALVVALLRTARIDLAPAVAYGIGGGIGFMCAMFTYRAVDDPLLTIVCQQHPALWAPAILDRLGIPFTAVRTKTDASALLSMGTAVILPVARASLPWLPASADDGDEHVVLAIPDADGFRVLDGPDTGTRFDSGALIAAYMQTRRKHPVLALYRPVKLPGDPRPAFVAGVRATISGMTEPVLGNAFDVNFGLSGLEKWARLADATGREGWPALFGDSSVWHERLVDGIEREYTAPAAGRPLFAHTLRSAGMPRPADAFEKSGRHWRTISHQCRSGTLSYQQLAREVRTILSLETEGVRALAAAIE